MYESKDLPGTLQHQSILHSIIAYVDSMLLLCGRIERSAIESAGLANCRANDEPLSREVDRCIRYVLEVDSALRRGYLWSTIELLHYLRLSPNILPLARL